MVPVPGTEYYAERVPRTGGAPDLFAWQPTDRRKPAAWKPVPVKGAEWKPVAPDGDQQVRATVGGVTADVVFPSEAKRALALREFALGVEALERFARKEPLRRVHECVFGVLALESEPVDPRL